MSLILFVDSFSFYETKRVRVRVSPGASTCSGSRWGGASRRSLDRGEGYLSGRLHSWSSRVKSTVFLSCAALGLADEVRSWLGVLVPNVVANL